MLTSEQNETCSAQDGAAAWPMGARLEAYVARKLLRLPHPWLVRLSRVPPIERDGETLNAEMQFMLRARAMAGDSLSLWTGDVEQSRQAMRIGSALYGTVPGLPVVTQDVQLELDTPLAARVYRREDARATDGVLVFYHGGGFALGGLDTHDGTCRLLCSESGMTVVAVDYRLAPEHPFPAAVEDACAAYRFVRLFGEQLGLTPGLVAVGGDSAGGNLAAVVAQWARQQLDCPPPDSQLLIYPVLDSSSASESRALFADGFFIGTADIDAFSGLYLAHAEHLVHDPRVSPQHAVDVSGLCPTVLVTAGFDPLRDEGEAYAQRLRDAGNRVVSVRERGLLHGFINMIGVSPSAFAATRRIAWLLRDHCQN